MTSNYTTRMVQWRGWPQGNRWARPRTGRVGGLCGEGMGDMLGGGEEVYHTQSPWGDFIS